MNIVYKLVDPITKEIRYIGKTDTDLEKRLYQHVHRIDRKRNSPLVLWITSLSLKGLSPIIEPVMYSTL